MNKKQQKVLNAVYERPTSNNIAWRDIESLFSVLGCEITEGLGSRIRVKLNNERVVFHRPHPLPNTNKGAVESVRRFLINAGVKL